MKNITFDKYYERYYDRYYSMTGNDFPQGEWELLEKLSNQKGIENMSDEEVKTLFELHFCDVNLLDTKYSCDNCDDVFYEHNSHKDNDGFLICPNCSNNGIKETNNNVSEFYEI